MKLVSLLAPWVKKILPDCDILGIKNDSRQVTNGDLFLAYPGALTDGRLYITQAKGNGAAAIIYDPQHMPKTIELPDDIPCVALDELSDKLALLAKRFYGDVNQVPVIGITGTNGKTTIAYQLAQAYELLGRKAVYIGTLGHGQVHALQPLANTTPDSLAVHTFLHAYQQQGVAQICMEVSSHALSQGRVAHVDISTAIFTNLTLDHLDYHHTMNAYAEAKARLFEFPSLKFAIINHDDGYGDFMAQHLSKGVRLITYGLKEGSDVRAVRWKTDLFGSDLTIASPWGEHEVHVPLIGAFNIYNSLAVFTCLLANGFPVDQVLTIMGKLHASPGRMELVSKKPCVIVDYAHTPDALENVLTTLVQLKRGRLGVVFGCGGDRDKTKRPIMGRIASENADFVVVTSDNPRNENPETIMNEIIDGCVPSSELIKIIDREDAIEYALKIAKEDDIILIAGKGHETYQQIGQEKLMFSDKAVVEKLTP